MVIPFSWLVLLYFILFGQRFGKCDHWDFEVCRYNYHKIKVNVKGKRWRSDDNLNPQKKNLSDCSEAAERDERRKGESEAVPPPRARWGKRGVFFEPISRSILKEKIE